MSLRDALENRIGEIIDFSELIDLAEGSLLDEFCYNKGCQGSAAKVEKSDEGIFLVCIECSHKILL